MRARHTPLPLAGLAALATLLAGCGQPGAAPSKMEAPAATGELETNEDKAAYAIGFQFGAGIRENSLPLETAQVVRGVRDALEGKDPAVSEQEARQALGVLQKAAQAAAQQEQAATAGAALEKAEAYLVKNATRSGVQVTASGLQYEVLTEGDGARPKATDKVKVHYEGTLTNGTVFDSSYKRGQPTSFPLNRVIPGWTEGVQLMTVGSKYRFHLHPSLAYGERGAGPKIGPNEALVFQVELLAIEE